jgi:hypothetical protein
MSAAGEFGTIENIGDNELVTDAEILDLHAASKEKSKQREKELDRERAKKEDIDYQGQFYYSNFVCVKSKTVIPKLGGEGAIQSHKETCPWCLERQEEQRKADAIKYEGRQRMDYILHEIEWAEKDIAIAEKKIAEEKRQKLENWETAIKIIEDDLQHARYIIQKEEKEKDKLLHHENEIIRKDAQARYDEYLKSDDKTRRRQWL